MKELRHNYDTETVFEDLAAAKKYYMPDLAEFPEMAEYAEEIESAETLEELADALNKYADTFGFGGWYSVFEF